MAQPGTPAILSERRWVTLSFVAVAQLTVVLEATIVTIALPSAQRALGFPDSDRQRVVTAYALALGSMLLLRTAVACSGQARVNPVMYPPDGGRCVVLAPKDGAGGDPGWCPRPGTRQASLCLGSAGCQRRIPGPSRSQLSPMRLNAMRRHGSTANTDDRQRSSAMTNGPAHSQHQAIPVDDPKRPPLDEAALRAFVASSVALVPHYRTELLLPGAQR
jgi:hypothetical protein